MEKQSSSLLRSSTPTELLRHLADSTSLLATATSRSSDFSRLPLPSSLLVTRCRKTRGQEGNFVANNCPLACLAIVRRISVPVLLAFSVALPLPLSWHTCPFDF